MASTRSYQGLDHPTSSLRGEEPDAKQHLSPQPDGFRSRTATSDSLTTSPGRPVKRKGEDGPDGRSTSGSPSVSLRTTDASDSTDAAKRARLGERQPSGSPAPGHKAVTSASATLAAAPSPGGAAAADVPPVSPVVLGFQLSGADATTRDTVRSALGIKEQQQALILQRRREEQRLAAAKEGANEGESGTDQTDNSSSDEAGGKRATGKAAGLSIKMTGPSSDGGPRQSAPPASQGGSGFPSTSRQGSAATTPYPQPAYAAQPSASPAHYPLARSTSASGGPIGSRPSSTNAYSQRPAPSALPGYGPPNGHVMAPLPSPGYQQHAFAQQVIGVVPQRGVHPQQPYPTAPTPPSPTSAHKATFLAPFEKFYDALLDSRTLQSSQVALEHKTQDLHRQAAGLVHALEEHHRRAASVLGTLQASSQSLQEMVRAEVAVVRDESRREMAAVLRRVEELESKLEEARQQARVAADDANRVPGVAKMEAGMSAADLVTPSSEAADINQRADSEVGDDEPLAAAVASTKRGGRAPPPPPPTRKPSSGASAKGRPGSKR